MMQKCRTLVHPEVNLSENNQILYRKAARAIVIKNKKILLMYTARYDDYSLPGGGVEENEDLAVGLARELGEETGAQNIKIGEPFGCYEEFRPWNRGEHDVLHMESFCFYCDIDDELGKPNLEPYEIGNGMKAKWVDIFDAIRHNTHVIEQSDKKGMSIERETDLLIMLADKHF